MTKEEFNQLQTIHNIAKLGHPCPSDIVNGASSLIQRGWVEIAGQQEKSGAANLIVTDDAKWASVAAGFSFEAGRR